MQQRFDEAGRGAAGLGDADVRAVTIDAGVESRDIGGDQFTLALGERRRAAHRRLREFAERPASRGMGAVEVAHHRLIGQHSKAWHGFLLSRDKLALSHARAEA